jgi:hypothetical protein
MNCSNCGHENPPGKKFCRQCGTSLTAGSPSAPTPQSTSLQESLDELGIRVSSGQIGGFLLAVAVGWGVGQLLNFGFVLIIYMQTIGRIQDLLGLQQGGVRDTFNIFVMTALPFLASFIISWLFFRKQ